LSEKTAGGSGPRTLRVPFNRVEGDLDIRVEIKDGQVSEAWVSGTMFRGFETMMIGRGPLDGLVITPRICGICSTSHLHAAALALDRLSAAEVPGNATRLRNVTQMAEHLQSDMRHLFLMFAVDFTDSSYQNRKFYSRAGERYTPFKGSTLIEVVRQTRRILEIVAIIGGQWPHSSFMVPGGIVSLPSASDLRQCRILVAQFRQWFEKQVLGGDLQLWQQVTSADALEAWCREETRHQAELPLLLAINQELGLDRSGAGHGCYLSYGSLPLPADERDGHLFAAGFWQQGVLGPFNQKHITEDVTNSWFAASNIGAPLLSAPLPLMDKPGGAYSWVKAPRYQLSPAETGPLGELLIAGNPLLSDWINRRGESVFVRELSRVVRCAELLPTMERWLQEAADGGRFYLEPAVITTGSGFGLTQASRGALGHWLRVIDGQIAHYQIISPTSWNASPRDSRGVHGPLEQALLGTQVTDPQHPVELGHIVRSFDPCLVCAVHTYHQGEKRSRLRIGLA
jgi:hydrogenase large subunit